MSTPVLVTKLYVPPPRSKVVLRPRLMERLNEGLRAGRKLTLISAPAGFGKTTLVSRWIDELRLDDRQAEAASQDAIANLQSSVFTHHSSLVPRHSALGTRAAWLSLDEGDNDSTRFLLYLVAALQTIQTNIGVAVLPLLLSPQPPPTDWVLTTLLNDIASVPGHFILVLDDYHLIDARPVDQALTFLLERLPPQLHLVIATREDPPLPLARWRGQGQLTELRAADLRFTATEAAEFLNQVMGLDLSAANISALEDRTEGWIAGLQLAALWIQGQPDSASLIQSFSGSHQFIMDYLVEEVLHQQPARVQTFLLRTSILDRLCGPLCDALLDEGWTSQSMLESLAQANLFIVPLDKERRWYRYHHLFADLLRQRLRHSAVSLGEAEREVAELHGRASQWYEDQGLDIEAFHHAVRANDLERAERLMDGQGIPLHFKGAVTALLDWLASLPTSVLNARPWLWWKYASLLLINGQTTGVAEKLQAAEAALPGVEETAKTRSLVGQIAAARATLALTRYDVANMLAESRRALAHLPSTNLSLRANAHWTLGYGYFLQGDRTAARQALIEAATLSQTAGAIFTTILATIGVGNVEEADNHLYRAADIYRRVLQMAGDQPLQIIHEAHLGLARILYEWNDLDAAEQHGRQSLHLARQYDQVIDRFILSEVFLARVRLAREDVAGAATILAQARQTARAQNFAHRLPDVTAAQVLTWLRQGHLAAAAQVAQTHPLPLSQARVHLAQGHPAAALAVLEPWGQQVEAKGWADERLKVMTLQAVALYQSGDMDTATQLLGDALALAEPGGFIRLFVDEGPPMAHLLSAAATRGIMPDYSARLLVGFATPSEDGPLVRRPPSSVLRLPPAMGGPPSLIESLSQRELDVLRLIAQGLSNDQISARLCLALSTVKGHTAKIFGKLQVQRRTEAVARARELGLL